MDIVIAGAGIGGLAVACALAQRGARVEVLERAEALTEIGAGIQISPNGAVVLEALGLGEALDAQSVKADTVSLRDYRRGEVLRLDPGQAGQGFHLLHRADLVGLLAEAAREAGATLTFGAEVTDVAPGERARLSLNGGHERSPDLVIGADGLSSPVRRAITPTGRPFFTGQVAFRALVRTSEAPGAQVRLYMAPRRHVVLYPLRGGRLLNVVAIEECDDWTEEGWAHPADPEDMRARFADFAPEVTAVMGRVEHAYRWALFRHEVAQSWHQGGVAILGDAAHPMLPFLAQGANMALEDAWVLASELEGEGDLAARLSRYQSRRRTRVARVVEAANGNAWKYHLSFAPLRLAARSYLRLMGALAPGRMLGQFDWLYTHDVTRGD